MVYPPKTVTHPSPLVSYERSVAYSCIGLSAAIGVQNTHKITDFFKHDAPFVVSGCERRIVCANEIVVYGQKSE